MDWGANKPEDYLAIHDWFDESKAHLADFGTARFGITAKASSCALPF
jgi:hypothetical protein